MRRVMGPSEYALPFVKGRAKLQGCATFKPIAGGNRTGILTITDNAPGSPHTVTLTGTGQDFRVTAAV
jgi:hypothetical protein